MIVPRKSIGYGGPQLSQQNKKTHGKKKTLAAKRKRLTAIQIKKAHGKKKKTHGKKKNSGGLGRVARTCGPPS